MPSNDAGDSGSSARHGGWDALALQVPKEVRTQRWVDQGSTRGGRERANAPYDLHGGGEA